MRTLLVAAGSLLAGSLLTCTAVEKPVAAHPRVRSPISVVYASSDMNPACRLATTLAVEHLQALGAELDLVFVEADHRALALEPHVGEVTVTDGLTNAPLELGETYAWRTLGGTVLRAEVIVSHCSAEVVLHQLAHVTGYQRQADYEKVMHEGEGERWGLDPDQRP